MEVEEARRAVTDEGNPDEAQLMHELGVSQVRRDRRTAIVGLLGASALLFILYMAVFRLSTDDSPVVQVTDAGKQKIGTWAWLLGGACALVGVLCILNIVRSTIWLARNARKSA